MSKKEETIKAKAKIEKEKKEKTFFLAKIVKLSPKAKPLAKPLFYKRGFYLEGEAEATKFSAKSHIGKRLSQTKGQENDFSQAIWEAIPVKR